MKLFIKTFGCQQNVADSERIASYYLARGYEMTADEMEADLIVINSCMIREKAEERVYGYIRNLRKARGPEELRIVLTGCIVGAVAREPSGKMKKKLEKRIPDVELLSIDEVGFEYPPVRAISDKRQVTSDREGNKGKSPQPPFPKGEPIQQAQDRSIRQAEGKPAFAKATTGKPAFAETLRRGKHGWVVVSNGCNNYCAFCIVPFSRGKEVSRPYEDILNEVKEMVADGYTSITLLGQNVNSYGADLVQLKMKNEKLKMEERNPTSNFQLPTSFCNSRSTHYNPQPTTYQLPNGQEVSPIMVKHLGRHRIPTLFPYLLEDVAKVPGVEKITFTSSNPWDFSDELIDVIERNKNIDRMLHLPVQSGSTKILKAMNRWYTREEYLALLGRIKEKMPEVQFITDIIVGFPGETEEDFEETVSLSKEAGFVRAFIGCYSPRPGTQATKNMQDAIEWNEKKRRMHILNDLINKMHQGVSEGSDWIRTERKVK